MIEVRRLLVRATLGGVLVVAAAGAASATTRNYPGPAPCDTTLKACIDGAASGDLIQIVTNGPIATDAGLVQIESKSLTLRAGSGYKPTFSGFALILAIGDGAADYSFTIQGLTIPAGGGIRVLQVSTGTMSVKLLDNVIQTQPNYGTGIEVDTGGATGAGNLSFLISGNQITVPPAGDSPDSQGIVVSSNGSAYSAGVIQNNRVQMGLNHQSAAIQVYGPSNTMVVDVVGNIITGDNYDTGISVRQSDNGTLWTRVSSNVVSGQNGNVGAPAGIVVDSSGAMTAFVTNNTVHNSRIGMIIGGRADLGAQLYGRIANNIFANNTQTGLSFDTEFEGTMTNGYNLFFGNAANYWEDFTPGPGTLYTDPLFVGGGDFHPRAGSPAINAGNNADVPGGNVLDVDRKRRILGVKADIGAYEYGIGDLILRKSNGDVRSLRSTGTAFGGFLAASNPAAISTGDNSDGSPYPSSINVPAYAGAVDQVTATLKGYSHTFSRDVDALLVGPTGQKVMLMSDIGGSSDPPAVNLTFQDGAPLLSTTLPASGTYSPTDLADGEGTDLFTGVTAPYSSALSAFTNVNPVGTWNLYVHDDFGPDTGSFAGGWSVGISERPWSSGFVPHLYDVYYADVNGDGRRDLVSRHKTTGNVEVFFSTGSSFVYAPGTGPGGVWSYGWGTSYDLYLADVTGDGKADLVGRLRTTGDVYVFTSTGTGFANAGLWSYGWSSGYDLYFADTTGDGKADLISRYFGPSAGTGNIEVGISTGSGFTYSGVWTYGYSAGYDLYFADTTGPGAVADGKADLVARLASTGDVYVMRSTGSGLVWDSTAPWTYGFSSTYTLVIRDFTGDGRADLAGRHTGTGDFSVARSTGSAFTFLGTWAMGVDSTFEIR